VKLNMIPPGPKVLARRRQYVIVGDVLASVTCLIIIRIGKELYHILCSQDRVPLGGKTTIEVYRGLIPTTTPSEKLGLELLKRKIPNLLVEADLLETRNLGYYWSNTGYCGSIIPIQAFFFVAKNVTNLADFKASLKLDHSMDEDPKTGPTTPATEPVIKTINEVETRINEVMNLDINKLTKRIENQLTWEAYLNDYLSMNALLVLDRSINQKGLPF
jgi:hypothetical protein